MNITKNSPIIARNLELYFSLVGSCLAGVEIGGVAWSVYVGYARSIGLLLTFMSISNFAIYQGFGLGSNIWLSNWSVKNKLPVEERLSPAMRERGVIIGEIACSTLVVVTSVKPSKININ